MLGSVLNMVFMADFKKSTVQKVIRMLRFKWREDEFWDIEVVQLLQGLNVNVGQFQEKRRSENALVAPIATSTYSEGPELHLPSMKMLKASPNSISVKENMWEKRCQLKQWLKLKFNY